jgi:uncharacterized protein YuzE
MTITYDQETDMLYIELVDRPSTESEEAQPGLVLDFDEAGRVVGLEFEHASEKVDLTRLESRRLPVLSASRSLKKS